MRQGLLVEVIPLHQKIARGMSRSALLVLFLAVLFVLLIACVNVANLQLARTAGRKRDSAVRAAIGARRARLLQLSSYGRLHIGGDWRRGRIASGVHGRSASAHFPARRDPSIRAISIDRRVLLFTLFTTCLTAILFGLAPALRASRPDVNDALKDGSRSTGLSLHRGYRGVLIVVEFTLAFLLLIGSGLLIRSFARLSSVAPGFDPTNVLTVNTELPRTKYSTDQQRTAFFLEILDRLRALSGVRSAAVTTEIPIIGHWGSSSFLVEGQPEPPRGAAPTVFDAEVTQTIFRPCTSLSSLGKPSTFPISRPIPTK